MCVSEGERESIFFYPDRSEREREKDQKGNPKKRR
jgi:hypothetical protein